MPQRGAGVEPQAVVGIRHGVAAAHRVEHVGARLGTRHAHAEQVEDRAWRVAQIADLARSTRQPADAAANTGSRTPGQRITHRREDLIDGDRIFPATVAFETRAFANRPC